MRYDRARRTLDRHATYIHQFSAGFNPPDGFDLPTWDIATMFNPERLRLIETASYRRQVDVLIGTARERFAEFTATPLTYGVLHHDYILLNCLHSGRQTRVWRGWAGIPLVAGAAVSCFPYTGWWGGDVGVR